MRLKVFGVVIGSVIYRFIVALALRINISAEYFKLVSALIVAVAIAAPKMREKLAFMRKKSVSMRKMRKEVMSDVNNDRREQNL